MPVLLALFVALAALPLQAAHARDAHASGLLSDPVANAQGRRIGTLDDLLVDVYAGRVRYALIDRGRRSFAYPATALQPDIRSGGVVLGEGRTSASAPGTERHGRLVGATHLIGREVRFADGRPAGELRDLVFDLESGAVLYALVAYEPTWGDAPVGVPFSRLAIPRGGSAITLSRETDARELAPPGAPPSDVRRHRR
jgi:sporulation protein YlmC with PRC-barrel domain